MTYNPYDENNRRDEVEANIERNRMERDGFICRPITRTLPPTPGTDATEASGSQPHPEAGDGGGDEPHDFPDVTPSTTPPRDVDVLHHMRDTGGGFARKLADAWFKADLRNQELLHGAFGWLYEKYRDSLYGDNERKV